MYSGTEQLEGATVYKFVMTIPPTQTTTMEVPGSLVGSDEPTFEAARFYSNVRTLLVEPTTGSIVRGSEQQKQTLRGPDGTDRVTLLEASIGYTEAEVRESVASAMDSANLLNTLKTTVPLVAVILGLISLVAGVLVVRRSESDFSELDDDYEWDTAPA